MMPRRFFFGLVEVPFWEFRSGLTIAQIELISIDVPQIIYKADEDNDKPWKKGTVSESYTNKQYQKWLEKKKKREAEGKDFDASQILSKGKRIDFMHFVDTGEKREITD